MCDYQRFKKPLNFIKLVSIYHPDRNITKESSGLLNCIVTQTSEQMGKKRQVVFCTEPMYSSVLLQLAGQLLQNQLLSIQVNSIGLKISTGESGYTTDIGSCYRTWVFVC